MATLEIDRPSWSIINTQYINEFNWYIKDEEDNSIHEKERSENVCAIRDSIRCKYIIKLIWLIALPQDLSQKWQGIA